MADITQCYSFTLCFIYLHFLDVMACGRDGDFGIKGYRDRGVNTAEFTVEK